MIRNMLVVAALLLTSLPASAVAAESNSEHLSKNAQKVLSILNSIGMNGPEVRNFVEEANSHVEDGYLNLAKEQALGGEWALRYPLGSPYSPDGFFKSRRLELRYTPEDSHFYINTRTDGIIIRYRLKFE